MCLGRRQRRVHEQHHAGADRPPQHLAVHHLPSQPAQRRDAPGEGPDPVLMTMRACGHLGSCEVTCRQGPSLRHAVCTWRPMQGQFASSTLAPTNGTWLGGPQASLSGSYNGQQKTVLLTLAACVAASPPCPRPGVWAHGPLLPACCMHLHARKRLHVRPAAAVFVAGPAARMHRMPSEHAKESLCST